MIELFECAPLSARISERQCGVNRERGLYSCLKCGGLSGAVVVEEVIERPVPVVPVQVVDQKKDQGGSVAKVTGICKGCEREMPITGNGMCGRCYYRAKKGMDLNAPAVSVRSPTLPSCPPEVASAGDALSTISIPVPARENQALDAPAVVSEFSELLDLELEEIGIMLKAKNQAYGNSALDPVRIFSKSNPVEQIRVRIDDKLSRLMRGGASDGEDTELDLLGYLLLLRVAKRMVG